MEVMLLIFFAVSIKKTDIFLSLQPGLDLQQYIEKKADQLKRYHIKVQPQVVVLSENLTTVQNAVFYAVLQNRVFYECQSLLEAVDVCIKASFVFNLNYAPAAYSSWLFLQRVVYDINTPYDAMPSKVLALQSDIANA
jgi:hypothetical protein